MRRTLVCAILMMAAIVGAKKASAEFRYGPTAGVNVSDLNFKQDICTVDKSVGYSAGVTGELMFPGIGFGIDIGLQYEQRGATIHFGEYKMWQMEGYGTDRSYLHYLVIPLHLRFKYTNMNGFEDVLAPFAYAGPSVGILVGHSKIDCLSYPFGELGIDFGIGAEIKRKWQISASYTMGVTYALKDKILTNYSARNSVWAVKVAYLF